LADTLATHAVGPRNASGPVDSFERIPSLVTLR